MKKRIVFSFLAVLTFSLVSAQSDMSRYFEEEGYSIVNLNDFLSVEFKWTLAGRIQVPMNEGINEFLEGNIQKSILNLDQVIKSDSTFWPAYYYRALCYKRITQYVAAEQDFQHSIRIKKDIPQVYLELGELYLNQRKFKEARNQYEIAQQVSPNLVEVYFFLGNLHMVQGEENKAFRQYQKCNEIDAKFPGAYVAQGLIKYRTNRKNTDANLYYFNKAIQADSSCRPAYFYRGLVYATANDYPHALADWNRLIEFNPSNPFLLSMRGYVLIEMENYDDAFRDFRKVLLTQRENENRYLSGKTLLDKKIDLQNAARYLIRKGYGLNETAFDFIKKGFCLLLVGKNQEAIKALNRAHFIEPSSSVYLMKAVTFEQTFEYDSSLSNYSKALALDNDIFDAHKKRAIYRFELKDWKGTYEDFKEMKRIEPESDVTYRLSGLIKANLKDYYGCIIDLAKFLKNDSTDIQSWQTRGFCRSEVKDYKGAIDDYNKCIQIMPNKKDLYYQVWKNYTLLADTVHIFKTLTIMRTKWPDDLKIRLETSANFLTYKMYDSATYWVQQTIKGLGHSMMYDQAYESAAYFILGQISIEQRDFETGLTRIDQSLKIMPDNEKLLYRAKLYLQLGKTKEAIKDLKKLQSNKYAPAEPLFREYLNK